MTFLSLHFPALVFRKQLGLWGGKATEYLFMALQKAGSKKREENSLLLPHWRLLLKPRPAAGTWQMPSKVMDSQPSLRLQY